MEERVDKQWKQKGLETYSTRAILGTLAHYGVELDEAEFEQAAAERYPLELAGAWKPKWKGIGPFADFPYAAVNELFARLLPARTTPLAVARLLMELIAAGLRVVNGQPSDLAGALEKMETLLPSLPPPGEVRNRFTGELVGFIQSWALPFNSLPVKLAQKEERELALRFAQLQEALLPDRRGCATALVRASLGEREAVVEELDQRVSDEAADVYHRYAALDALLQLDAVDRVEKRGLPLFDAVAKEERWGLADTIAHALAHLIQKVGGTPEFAREVHQRLELAHQRGGHH